MAIKKDGTLWSWGLDSSGLLGSGSAAITYRLAPGPIGNKSNWTFISAGGSCTLALHS